jgi:hypothetical protein
MGHIWPTFAEEEIWDFFMQITATNPIGFDEKINSETELLKTTDLLDRISSQKGIHLNIFDNGIIEKKYVIK